MVRAESLSGINQKIEGWEELEFMVDSGAGHTVVNPEQVRAVATREPRPGNIYNLADGNIIHHKGSKKFRAATEDYSMHVLEAQVTDVDTPLLSVSQVVRGGIQSSSPRKAVTSTSQVQSTALARSCPCA